MVAAGGSAETVQNHGLNPMVLVGIAVMLGVAKLGGELFERIGQPAVLGELVGGIILGNLVLFGFTAAEPLKTNDVISALAEIGVIILLFEVGLESDLKEMIEVGWSSLLVAVLGVVVPFFLGWGVSAFFLPGGAQLEHIFIGATLCATSVGITARVFRDLNKLGTREARIILGAAVIDDVPAGRLYRDGSILGSLDSVGVLERRRMSYSGHVAVSVILDDRGDMLADPEVVREAVARAARASINEAWGKKPVCTVFIAVV
jgi:hypothetical protein